MTTINGIKKLKKAGYSVTQSKNKYTAEIKSKTKFIEFYTQEGEIIIIKVQRKGQDGKVISDYQAEFFFRNISQALRFANN